MRMAINQLLERMVPDAEACEAAADQLRAAHPRETPERLARRAITTARKQGMAIGALTGAASNPFAMVPAALADMAGMLKIEGTMAGTIAALLDPPSLHTGTLQADVVGILFPSAVSQALRQVGVRAGEQASKTLLRKTLTEDMLKTIIRLAGRRLGFEVTRNALVEKAVPLVGAGIGAGWNWMEAGAVGDRAIRYYKGEPLVLPGEGAVKRIKSVVKGVASRLPGARRKTALPPPLPALPAPGQGVERRE